MVFSHGVTGGKGRCYPFWQDLMYCMARVGALHGEKCTLQFEDYLECLHHTKLVGRVMHLLMLQTVIIVVGVCCATTIYSIKLNAK